MRPAQILRTVDRNALSRNQTKGTRKEISIPLPEKISVDPLQNSNQNKYTKKKVV